MWGLCWASRTASIHSGVSVTHRNCVVRSSARARSSMASAGALPSSAAMSARTGRRTGRAPGRWPSPTNRTSQWGGGSVEPRSGSRFGSSRRGAWRRARPGPRAGSAGRVPPVRPPGPRTGRPRRGWCPRQGEGPVERTGQQQRVHGRPGRPGPLEEFERHIPPAPGASTLLRPPRPWMITGRRLTRPSSISRSMSAGRDRPPHCAAGR